jgi:hypothetical protein
METTFGRWIAANQALIDCQAKFNKAQIDAMSEQDQAKICHSESAAVAAFLRNDQVSIRHLIEEKLKHMN